MQEAPAAGSADRKDPWAVLRAQQDRARYLKVLRAAAGDGRKVPGVARMLTSGLARRSHPLLGSPASITRSGSYLPLQQNVRDYLRHSADLTMRGGNAAGLVYPLAACALAEHYVFRRIGGSSSGAPAAAATAAAELGRTAPDPTGTPKLPTRQQPHPPTSGVLPGFAGLAQLVDWLAGGDEPGGREQHRLARLLQPAGTTRGLYRVLVLTARARVAGPRTAVRLLIAGLSLLTTRSAALLGVIWVGLAGGWLGLTSALASASRDGAIAGRLTDLISIVLLITFVVAGLGVSALAEVLSAAGRLRHGGQERFGLIPGSRTEQPRESDRSGDSGRSRASRRTAGWLDRWAGVPAARDQPPLFDWLTDRLDDLAGITATGGRGAAALTLGDLWSGSVGERTAEQAAHLRLAAGQPEHRVIDLTLVTTDLSGRRAYRLPFLAADQAERTGGARFLFCETCLTGLLPERIVTQMIKAAPSTDTDHPCPRHRAGVLRELPEPWDLPVAFALRLSFSPPGLFCAVPLYSIHLPGAGSTAGTASAGAGAARTSDVVRTHWFVDGGLTGNVPVSYFDALLPRWPTFGITLEDADPSGTSRMMRLPEQDAAPARRSWRSIDSASGLLRALLDSGLSWRDSAQADLPGFRGRVAMIRRTAAEHGVPFDLSQRTLLELAMRGLQAGTALRERFTGSDDLVPGQTQTDRYRWIRLRMALREFRGLSQSIAGRLPLYRDLASSYHVPEALTPWFDPPLPPAERDPIWADAASAVVTMRALSAGGVLDFDTDRGAPPTAPYLQILPPD